MSGLRRSARRASARTLLLLLSSFGLLGSSRTAPEGQSSPTPLPVEDMARDARVIGVATVQAVQARKDESTGLVYTDYTLDFSEVWKGTPPNPFILAKAGGTLGAQRSAILGREYRLEVGESLVVFATESLGNRFAVLGLRQGLYRIGSGADPMLFRVSEFPERRGESSSLRLGALRDQVFRVIPRPGIPGAHDPLPSGEASSTGKPPGDRSPSPTPALPLPESGPGRSADAGAGSSRILAVLGLGILAAIGIFVVLRRK